MWAGVVRWDRAGDERAVALEWGRDTSRPDENALVSWLLRDAEVDAELVRAGENDLRPARAGLAVPLGPEGSPIAFLVLAFATAPARPLVDALTSRRDELTDALALPALRLADQPSALAS